MKRIVLILILAIAAGTVFAQSSDAIVWTGDMIEFSKDDGADPGVASNQDRITDSVWITRANTGGQIFNIAEERRPNANTSPRGTQWALGTTADLDNLNFQSFRRTVGKPRTVVGRELVLHLVEENIYIDIIFTSWSDKKDGGFTYMRSTPEN